MTPPGTFDRVYAAIKQRLRAGRYRPGDRLEPAALSDELNASVTPVRDALHRLTGERLVEAPRQEGFRVPLLTETMLRHLYAWHRDLLILAIANRRTANRPEAQSDTSGAGTDTSALFLRLARLANNPEHLRVLDGLADRLEPVQRLEGSVLDAVEEETAAIAAALQAGDRRALRRSLLSYHRRRERVIPDLLDLLYRPRQ